jgi:hypothetical protein
MDCLLSGGSVYEGDDKEAAHAKIVGWMDARRDEWLTVMPDA